MKKSGIRDVFNTLPLVSQLGISLVVPLVFCLLICYFLADRFGLGSWIYIIGIILGLGAFAATCYRIYKKETDKSKHADAPAAFNNHI